MIKINQLSKLVSTLLLLFTMSFAYGQNDSTWIHSYIKLKTHWKTSLQRLEFKTCVINDSVFDPITGTNIAVLPLDSIQTLLVINGDTISHYPNSVTPVFGPFGLGSNIHIYFRATVTGYPVNRFPDYIFETNITNDIFTPSIAYLISPNPAFFKLPLSLLETHKNSGSNSPCNGKMDLNITGGYPFTYVGDPYLIRWDIPNSDYNEYQDTLCQGIKRYQFHDDWFKCYSGTRVSDTVYNLTVCSYDAFFCEEQEIENSTCTISMNQIPLSCTASDVTAYLSTSDGAINATISGSINQNYSSSLPTVFNETTSIIVPIPDFIFAIGDVLFIDSTTTNCYSSINVDNQFFVVPPANITVLAVCGETSASVMWQDPIVTSNYPYTWSSNYMSGSIFPVGTATITFLVESENCTQISEFDVTVLPADNCGNCISGYVTCEDNTPMINVPVDIMGLPYQLTVFTDIDGFYSYCNDTIDFSTITAPVINSCWLTSNGNVDTSIITWNGSSQYSSNWDFTLNCNTNPCVDLATNINSWIGYYQGTVATIYLNTYGSTSSNSIGNYTLTLTFPTNLTINGGIPSGGILTGNTITWNLSEATNSFYDNYFVSFNIPNGIQDGDVHLFASTITPVSNEDCYTPDNHSCAAFVVGNSYDPNDKVVDLPTYINESIAEELTYSISFQNTGTAPAQNVYIMDTLSDLLDWSTFQVIRHSHDLVVTKDVNGVVKFNFPSIWLPTETANEPLSHGFVTYKIKEKEGNELRSEILNTAYIYFDLNEPIITSTTININNKLMIVELSEFDQKSFSTYPNPVIDALTIKSEGLISKVRITDAQGRLIETIDCNTNSIDLNLSSYASGIYTLSILNENNNWINKKVVKK